MLEPVLPVDLRVRGRIDQPTVRLAMRAVLAGIHLAGLSTGAHLRQLRATRDPLVQLQARAEQAELTAKVLADLLEIVIARFAKVPERHRPHYTPAQRFRILELKNLLAWPADTMARTVLVCTNTILNWERQVDPKIPTVGSTLKPTPPVRRAADSVRRLTQTLAHLGIGGGDMLARVLARAGWRVSARSVRRYVKERSVPGPAPTDPPSAVTRANPVTARFIHHVWMMDVSEVPRLFGGTLYMAAVFDAFSRVPLVLQVLDRRPSASDMARLLRTAASRFAAPRHAITDLGGEFTGKTFTRAVARLGSLHRTASADNIKATARLERFWRTLKDTAHLHGLRRPVSRPDLERRLEHALVYYVAFRPHEGLGGATPLEAFRGHSPAHLKAVEPPRARRGEGGSLPVPFTIGYVDAERRAHPVLLAA